MIILLLVCLGLVLGSFANATIWRLYQQDAQLTGRARKGKKVRGIEAGRKPEDFSILTGRSMCTHCGHQLAVMDLIPVFSYLWLRGRCRYCGKPIEDTPLIELIVPVLFVLSYMWWPYSFSTTWSVGNTGFYFWLIFLVGFVILSMYDLRWFLLPDRVLLSLFVLGLAQLALQVFIFQGGLTVVLDAMWGVICIAGVFWLLHLVSHGSWIGFGDVKLGVVLGLLVGGPINALLVIFIASLLGSLAALPLVIKGKAHATTPVPFGPFLMIATVIVVLFGASISTWYQALLGIR